MTAPNDDRPMTGAELYSAGPRDRRITRLPKLMWGAVTLVWRAAPRELVVSSALQLSAGFGVAGQVLIGKALLKRLLLLDENSGIAHVLPWLAAFAVVGAGVAFSNIARTEQQRLLGELSALHATQQVLAVSSAVDLVAFDSPAFHNRLQRALINAGMRPTQMVTGLLGILSSLVVLLGIAVALAIIEPLFLLIVAVAYTPLWLATLLASKANYRFSVDQIERDRQRNYLTSILTRKEEAAEIRAFELGEVLRHRYSALTDLRIAELRKLVRQRLRLTLIGGLAAWILNAGAIAVLAWFVSSGRLDLASAGSAAGAVLLFSQRLSVLASSTNSLYESSLFIEDFTSFVDAMPAIQSERPAAAPPKSFEHIRIEELRFRYPSREHDVLEGISMQITRGEVIALVGENGSGKTTLAKLLAGLYVPLAGRILWDDTDISTCDPRLVRDQVGVIFQDFAKYMLSAEENISFGDHRRRDDLKAVGDAARRASASEFIGQLPNDYGTQLGPQFYGGVDLSVGQWQRIAMARAFFRNAPFLILDEPTAALDPRSEAALFRNIRSLYAGRTVLLISHRFSTVRTADRIFVLDHGRIVESGTHADLMEAQGQYATMFSLQAAAFIDEPLPGL